MNLYIFYFFIFTLNAQELVPKPRPTTQLFKAIKAGNKMQAAAAILSGADINCTDKHETPLTLAIKLALENEAKAPEEAKASEEASEIVKLLLEACPNSMFINKPDGQQTPPVILTMENNTETSYEIFAELIKMRPDLSYIGHDGYNALQMAIETQNNFYFSEILTYYDLGYLLELKNGSGQDLIDLVIKEGDSSKTSLLLKIPKISAIFKKRIIQKLTFAASKTNSGINWSDLATQASKVNSFKRQAEDKSENPISKKMLTSKDEPWRNMYI